MSRTSEKIAKDFLESLCKEAGVEPTELYNVIQALDDVPELSNVRPSIRFPIGEKKVDIQADYTGKERLGEEVKDTDKKRYELYFQQLSETTGIEFLEAEDRAEGYIGLSSDEKEEDYYSAKVSTQKGKDLSVIIKQTIILKNQPK